MYKEIQVSDIMSKNVITIDADEDISAAISVMKKHNIHELPVMKNGRIHGLVTMDSLFKRKNLPLYTKVSNISLVPPTVNERDTFYAVARKLIETGFRGIPVVNDKGSVAGVVSRSDLIKIVPKIKEICRIPISDVYTPSPTVLKDTDSIRMALNFMKVFDEHSMPVVDKKGRLIGVVGLKDILDYYHRDRKGGMDIASDKKQIDVTLKSVMMTDPVTVDEGKTIDFAVSLMLTNNITTLFIVDGNEVPTGVISQYDIISMMTEVSKSGENVNVVITGEVDSEFYGDMNDIIQKSIKRIGKIVTPRLLSIHVNRYNSNDNTIYDVHTKMSVVKKAYFGGYKHWNVFKALDITLRDVEHQIKKEKDIMVSNKKRGLK